MAQETKGMAQEAVRTAKDTTDVLTQAYKTTLQAEDVATATLIELKHQGEILDQATEKAAKVNEDLNYVQRVAGYMNLCMCCFLCCDPPEKRAARKKAAAGAAAAKAKASAAKNGATARKAAEKDDRQKLLAPGQKYQPSAGPSYQQVLAGHGYGEEGKLIDEEHQKQDQVLGKIWNKLDDLQSVAEAQGEEIKRQQPKISRLGQEINQGVVGAQKLEGDLKALTKK